MNITVLHRPPYDLFTMRLFYRLVHDVKRPADAVYLWTRFFDKTLDPLSDINNETYCKRILFNAIKNDLVILGIKDHMTAGWFNPYIEQKPNMVEYFENMFDYYNHKQFIVFSSCENLKFDNSNVNVVNWGGDLTNQKFQYSQLDPVFNKNLDSDYAFLCLNRNGRHHRTFTLSALLGLDLERYGFITCMFQRFLPRSLEDLQCPLEGHIGAMYRKGFNKLQHIKFSADDCYKIYPNEDNDNVFNFNNSLREYYANTFIEIVTETSFTEHCYLLTEKTLNSIYGCNFPILLAGKGAVSFLRNMGLDVFDDIIDHSYDQIDDPLDRIYSAIHRNINLLSDVEAVKQLWQDNLHRFKSNVEFARSELYKFYETRTEKQWKALKHFYD